MRSHELGLVNRLIIPGPYFKCNLFKCNLSYPDLTYTFLKCNLSYPDESFFCKIFEKGRYLNLPPIFPTPSPTKKKTTISSISNMCSHKLSSTKFNPLRVGYVPWINGCWNGSPKRWDRWHSPSPNWQVCHTTYIHLYLIVLAEPGGFQVPTDLTELRGTISTSHWIYPLVN